jgi:hypothetical protein
MEPGIAAKVWLRLGLQKLEKLLKIPDLGGGNAMIF